MPPNTATAYTLPIRPCSSVGTARIRTAVDSVPHTNTCAPKTTMIAIATQAVVVSASPRWVKRLDGQHDAHQRREPRAALEPVVAERPGDPADRDERGQQAEPDGPSPSCSSA